MEAPETEITLETIIIQPMVNNDAVIAEIGVPEINAKIMIQEEIEDLVEEIEMVVKVQCNKLLAISEGAAKMVNMSVGQAGATVAVAEVTAATAATAVAAGVTEANAAAAGVTEVTVANNSNNEVISQVGNGVMATPGVKIPGGPDPTAPTNPKMDPKMGVRVKKGVCPNTEPPVSKPVETLPVVKYNPAGESEGAGVTAEAVEIGVRVAAALVLATEEVGQMGKNVLQVTEILVNGLIARILSHRTSAVIIKDITIMVEVPKVTEVSKVEVPKVTEANKAVALKEATEVNLVVVTEQATRATKEATMNNEVTKRPYLPFRHRSTK